MKQKLLTLFMVVSWIFSAIVIFSYLFTANIPFWYDPARDMLSAWANLSKLTLIGPPSGIPGFFYGPYWIWWLSVGQLFSKNPSVVTGITMAIPYLVVFFGVLMLFSKIFGRLTAILLWILFFLNFNGYMTQLWNPYLAPVLYLSTMYILVFSTSLLSILLAGVITGIALNIHISFSVGFAIGCFLYLLVQHMRGKLTQTIKIIGSFIFGIFLAFIPFFLFEIRHGFHQTSIAVNAFLHGGDVVAQHGFTKQEIIQQTALKFSQLLHMPSTTGWVVLISTITVVIYLAVSKKLTLTEKKLLLLISFIIFGVLSIYLLAKNPIWDYHFYGFEVVWLLLIGVVAARITVVRFLLFIWIIGIGILWTGDFLHSLQVNPLSRGSLYTKEYIVKTIQKDAGRHDYAVYAYSQSIYTYEYNYLFRWMTGKEFSYDPVQIQQKNITYLILPPAKQTNLEDFVHFRTPDNKYKTIAVWHIADGTTILRRNLLQ